MWPTFAGGEIVRDAAGRPTGMFKDNAMALVDRAVPTDTLPQRLDATVAGDGLPGRARRHGRASHGHLAATSKCSASPTAAAC